MIRYDVLAQEAFRGLVKKVLTEVSHAGLPGDHHFYIMFDTRAPGVRLSARLRERYPEEMTVVIQHQFWELSVNETTFEVGLSFSGIPEKLVIPFASIRGFFDPSVEFAVQFPLVDEHGNAADAPADGALKAIGPATGSVAVREMPGSLPADKPRSEAVKLETKPAVAAKAEDKPAEIRKTDDRKAEDRQPDDRTAEGKKPEEGAAVVSLDAFRKKT
jgi:hypothetical protein